jgi:hypothetical protein
MAHAPTPNSDITHYAVLCAHQELGYFAERLLEDSCSRATLIKDIIDGNLTRVMKVFAFNPVEHTADDVTEDVARELASLLDAADMIPETLIDFIEANAGLEYARGLRAAE